MANAETGSVSFDNLVLPDADAVTVVRTLESGENVTRGALLKLGTGVKLVAADEYDAATDIITVAATDANATDGDVSINVFAHAALSAAAVAEASGLDSISTAIRNNLWLRGILIKDTLSLD
jgi:hypothetical protein